MREGLNISVSLARALAHKIRTPLSIIQNELSYLASLLPAGECERAFDACRSISQILALQAPFPAGNFETIEVTLGAFIDYSKINFEISNVKLREFKLKINQELFIKSLSIIQNIIDTVKPPSQTSTLPFITESDDRLNFEVNWKLLLSGDYALGSSSTLDTFSELFCIILHHDYVELPFADAVLLAHGCKISISLCAKHEALLQVKIAKAS